MTSIKGQQRKHVEHANKHIDTCKQQQNTLQPILSTDLATKLARSDNGAGTSCRVGFVVGTLLKILIGLSTTNTPTTDLPADTTKSCVA